MSAPTHPSERHQVALLAAQTASTVSCKGSSTPTDAAAAVVTAYRAAIAQLAKPIETETPKE